MPVKERGALLTVWLVLMLAANVMTTLLYSVIVISPVGRNLFLPDIQLWAIYAFISLSLLNLVCVCFLLLWKKWAFFVLCASAGTAFIINLFVGAGAFAFLGLAGVPILYLIMRPKWNLFNGF
jgi:hypothetical protein